MLVLVLKRFGTTKLDQPTDCQNRLVDRAKSIGLPGLEHYISGVVKSVFDVAVQNVLDFREIVIQKKMSWQGIQAN